MNSVNKIGFNFRAVDEAFVRDLYVGWDSFYRDSFDEVVDEFLSRHNEDGSLLRFDKLELNLGNIPQEDFYQLFPVRLREELERVFLFQASRTGARESFINQLSRRLACLRFYLEKGFCPTEWEEAEFDLEKEIRFLLPYTSASLADLFHQSIRQPNQLYRLKWNLSTELFGNLMLFWLEDKSIPQKEKEQRYTELRKVDPTLEPSLYKMQDSLPLLSEKLSALLSADNKDYHMTWLLSTTVSVYEKRRILSGLLEWEPIVVIRYIHETHDEKNIHSLAILLDKIMVRQIINAECEDHTEADVPTYWMYLYNWLLKYYPFNGIYMFGNKLQFQEYLNMKLLQFIRKRSYSAFLSKADITIHFLIEVFGQVYYLEVLNIIYNQQARNEDGSPVYTDYLNMELYYMFLHLSLLKIPVQPDKSQIDSILLSRGANEQPYSYDAQALHAWLTNKRIPAKEKQTFLTLLVRQHPSLLIKVLKAQAGNQALLAGLMEQTLIYELLSSVSFYAMELFIKLAEYIVSISGSISWLSGITSDRLSLSIRTTLLRWIGESESTATDPQKNVSLFLRMLYQEVSGSTSGRIPSSEGGEKQMKATIRQVSKQLSLSSDSETTVISASSSKALSAGQETALVPEWVSRLRILMMNKSVTDAEKQRVLAHLLDRFRHRCEEFISILRQQSLLKNCLLLMDKILFEQVVRQLVRKGCESQSVSLFSFYQWVLTNHAIFSASLSIDREVMRERMIVLLAHWAINGSLKDKKTSEIALLFLTGLFGANQVANVLRIIHQELLDSLVEDSYSQEQAPASEELLGLLVRMSDSLKSLPSGDLPEEWHEELSNESPNEPHETKQPASMPEGQDRSGEEEEEKEENTSVAPPSSPNEELTSYEWNEHKLAHWLQNPNISQAVKRQVIRKYIIWQPQRLFVLMQRLVNSQTILADEWLNWLDEEDLMHIIAGISLSKAELFDQIIISLRQRKRATDSSIRLGIIHYLVEKELANWLRESISETARRLIPYICCSDIATNEQAVTDEQGILHNPSTDDILSMVIDELLIKDMENNTMIENNIYEPIGMSVHNAGLVLLTPWFPRLFSMLGLLNDEKRDLKDMDARIRAIFITQYLVTFEDREYKESDLAFNRILVGCPFYEPLPPKMELTEQEIQTIESMLNGVKSNWTKMQHTSVLGFQHNFIERSGRMEQKDNKWMLTVESRAYDVLMDSIPWSYSRVQFPWSTMPIQVSWRSKQEF